MTIHPLLQDEDRPRIATKPIESLGDAILLALEDGYRGIQVYGRSGDGKTYAAEYLTTHLQWLRDSPAPTCWVTMPRRTRITDTIFYKIFQQAMRLAHHPIASAVDRLSQIVDWIASECLRMKSRRFIIFIDEAQRLSADDYDFIANIDDAVHLDGYRLFCVFVNQSDDHGRASKSRDKLSELPPQAVRRFFMAEYTFRGLVGVDEFAHALGRIGALEHDGVPFPACFAPAAYAAGWRLEQEAAGFVAALAELRAHHKLMGANDLSMAIFEPAARHLLIRVAPEKGVFREFAGEEIRTALITAGYLRLELLRARQKASSDWSFSEQRQKAS